MVRSMLGVCSKRFPSWSLGQLLCSELPGLLQMWLATQFPCNRCLSPPPPI